MKVLTISIAAYNVEKFIQSTLRSLEVPEILNEIEVLVIDDGGTDGTEKIAKDFQSKYPESFHFVHKENGGWGSTINTGIRLAKGKYYKHLDGDDMFESRNLPQFIDILRKSNVDAVFTPFVKFDSRTEEDYQLCACASNEVPSGKVLPIEQYEAQMQINMHLCTFRTEMLNSNKISITEKCFYTDAEFTFKALACVHNFIKLDMVIYRYRVGRGEQSVSLAGLKKHYMDHEKVLNEVLKEFQNKKHNNTWRHTMDKMVTELIHNQYMVYATIGMKNKIREYDKWIKIEYPEYYSKAGKKVRLLRLLGFQTVPALATFYSLENSLAQKHIVKPRMTYL